MTSDDLLRRVQKCFSTDAALYTRHARLEMASEEFGAIREYEVYEAICAGEVIEDYPDDMPYPSVLILGRTKAGRMLHIVCAYDAGDGFAVVVTTYEPDPDLWIDFKRRRQR